MATQLKTPGVYVRDLTPPQPFDVTIETSLPAFVGHTERALDGRGNSLAFVPIRVRDMTEFTVHFGGAFEPQEHRVGVDRSGDPVVRSVEIPRQFFLYEALLQFYDNGGRDCYIVSIGSYDDPIVAGDFERKKGGFAEGLAAVSNLDEPSLLLFPDAVMLPLTVVDGGSWPVDLGRLQQEALRQCARRKDRFLIADVAADARILDPVAAFRDALGVGDTLQFGAAYYPWLYSIADHRIRFDTLSFFDVLSGASLDDLSLFSSDREGDIAKGHQALVASAEQWTGEGQRMWRPFEAAGMRRSTRGGLPEQIQSRVRAFFHAYGTERAGEAYAALRAVLRPLVLLFPAGSTSSTPRPLRLEVQRLRRELPLATWLAHIVAFELRPDMRALHTPPATHAEIEAVYADVLSLEWSTPGITLSAEVQEAIRVLEETTSRVAEVADAFLQTLDTLVRESEEALFERHPFFREVEAAARLARKRLPPSGAVAGLYGTTDRNNGVWKAPANVAVRGTLGPIVPLDDHDQEPLNVHPSGKSINAIRTFRGRGTQVWGSRTLDGNSLEWRYVPVRRYVNFVEEFVKRAVEPFVFEANDANTWNNIRALLTRFLTVQWRQGALNGAQPHEAFAINIGLGQSMTAEDLLEGRLIVEIGLAVVRPAEFIVVRYLCRMEETP